MKSEIILNNVSLDFPIYDAKSLSIRNKVLDIGNTISNKSKTNISDSGTIIQALKDITLKFNHGDKVAIIGSNGSGKTTLLKLIAGIYHPTSGNANIKGELSCMLDIGFGFDGDVSMKILYYQILPGV